MVEYSTLIKMTLHVWEELHKEAYGLYPLQADSIWFCELESHAERCEVIGKLLVNHRTHGTDENAYVIRDHYPADRYGYFT